MLIIGSIIPNVSVNVAQSRNPNESKNPPWATVGIDTLNLVFL